MPRSYLVPVSQAEAELEVKRSRFIARAKRVESRQQAMEFLDQAREADPDARHHCWAYLFGCPDDAGGAAMNDDGEPAGTAGKPILNVIQHKRIGDVMVVVSRYFGGTKLGAGGLTRAYARATEAALSSLALKKQEPETKVRLTLDFAQEQLLRYWAHVHEARVGSVDYAQTVSLGLTLPQSKVNDLTEFCAVHDIVIDRREP